MSVLVTSFPVRNVNDSATYPSRWSAVHHPIFFNMCRQDVKVVQVQILNGVKRVLLQSMPPDLEVGQTIYLSSGQTNTSVVVAGISGNQISVTGNVAPYSTGGYINLTQARRNYIVETRIMAVDNNNVYYLVGTVESKPAPDGKFVMNPNGFLKTIAEMTDSFLYNQINKKIVGAGSRFNIQFRELWVGHEGSFSMLSNANVFYWTNATKQIQQRYNFNVAEHVLFPTLTTAKFLTNFERPTYFPGFPFALSFIWSDKVSGHALRRIEETYNTNGVLQTTTDTALDGSQSLAVNRMMLAGSYDSGKTRMKVWLNDNGLQPIKWVKDNFVASGYTKVQTRLPQIKQQ